MSKQKKEEFKEQLICSGENTEKNITFSVSMEKEATNEDKEKIQMFLL